MKLYLIALLSVMVAVFSPAAGADSLYLGAWSKHVGADNGASNENHQMLGYERNGYTIATMKNSFGNRTAVVGYSFKTEDFLIKDVDAALLVGASYGYYNCKGDAIYGDKRQVCPAIAPEFSYTKHKLQPAIILLPTNFDGAKPKTVAVVFALKLEI